MLDGLKKLKDGAVGVLAGSRDSVVRFASSDSAVSEEELGKRVAENFKRENGNLRVRLMEQDQLIESYAARFKELEVSQKEIISILLKTGTPYEVIYNLTAPCLDFDGRKRYDIARRMIPDFNLEDVEEEFETDDGRILRRPKKTGNELLYELELAAHGTSGPGEDRRLITDDKGYLAYRKRLLRRVLESFIEEP